MSSDNPKPPIRAGFLMNMALGAAAIGLWGPLLFFAFLWMGRGSGGQGAYFLAIATLQIGVFTCSAGALLVAIYAAVVRPWRRPASQVWFFWMQVLAVVVVGVSAGNFALQDWQEQHQRAAEQRQAEQAQAQQRQMDAALSGDDVITFTAHYQACGEYCARLPWLRKAVAAQAPRILASLLKGVTPTSYASDLSRAEQGGICKDGAYYEGDLSLAGLAGATGNQAIIDSLLALWDREAIQQAFEGAAMGNQVATMQALMERGADPHRTRTEQALPGEPVDDAMTLAVRTGAADALRWLAEQGARPANDGEKNGLWVIFSDWVNHSPPDVWTGRLDAVLDALDKLGVDPSHNGSEPLWPATDAGNARLIHVLLRRGARVEDVTDDSRRTQLQQLLAGPPDALGSADGRNAESCRRPSDE